jgi:hypothetical protein
MTLLRVCLIDVYKIHTNSLIMSTKYNYDNYVITIDFRSDFAMAITASDIYSGDYFIN